MINYRTLVDALAHYQACGYELIEVPWTVTKESLEITTPPNFNFENTKYLDKYLVGSAEQSFLDLIRNHKLSVGKYCAITPCFRNDDEDEIHQKYFMKVELIHYTNGLDESLLANMIHDARAFFDNYVSTAVIKTDGEVSRSILSYDITSTDANGFSDIELGSYGMRRHRDIDWIYGTGVAEPRLSYVSNKEKQR